jgi:hypothetical protein
MNTRGDRNAVDDLHLSTVISLIARYHTGMRKASAFVLIIVTFMAGCNSRPSLFGRWDVIGMSNRTRAQNQIMEFAKPNYINLVSEMPGNQGTLRIVGTFRYDGKVITTSFYNMVIEGQSDMANEARRKLTSEMKRIKLAELNEDPIITTEWVDRDKFLAIDSERGFVCNRIK